MEAINTKKQSVGFGKLGSILMIYQLIAYATYTAFTNFPQNVMSEFYGGTQTTTAMNLISGILGYCITYFIVAPRIAFIKNIKRTGILIGIVALIFCAAICIVPPTMPVLWCAFFVCVLITTQLWGCFFVTLIIGNWFPRRKGTVMGIVTMAFPIVTGFCLGIFQGQHASLVARGYSITMANVISFAPYWILAVIGMVLAAIFLKDWPEQAGAYRDNDKSFTAEMANKMLMEELELRKKSVWKRSKIWGCKDWWLQSIGTGMLLTCAIAFMVQIIPVLAKWMPVLHVLAVPNFPLMSNGISAVLFGLGIFACFGSWLLGVIDTKYGVRFAVLITGILMFIAGVLGCINNPWCAVAATWILGLFMGASSNFGLSSVVRYWRHEDYAAVMSGAPPLGVVTGAVFPFLIATLGTKLGYEYAFGFVSLMAVVSIVCTLCFNPMGIARYDNKLRAAAGLPVDDLLEKRYETDFLKLKNQK